MAEILNAFAAAPTMIDTLAIDAAVSELATFDAEVSEHPVEKGAAVVDHIRPKPVIVRIDGIVSDTPLNATQLARVNAALGETFDRPTNAPGYADGALAFLLTLRTNPRLVTIDTKRKTYTDMALTSLSVPEDVKTGDALRFTATFRQVRQVSVRRVPFLVARPALKPKVKAGTKPTATAPQATQNRSIAAKLLQAAADSSVQPGGFLEGSTPPAWLENLFPVGK